MNLHQTFIENKKIYLHTIKTAKKAKEIAMKIEPLLPEGWEAAYIIGTWRGLLFCCHHHFEKEHPSTEFKLVCKLIEIHTGQKVEKKPWIEGDMLFCLKGEAVVPFNENGRLIIEIRHFSPTQCRLDYEEKTVRIAKVSDSCLGLEGS